MSAPVRGWTGRLVDGLAGWLAGQGLGTWRPDQPYQPGDQLPILVQDLDDAPGDRVLVLTPYSVQDLPGRTDVIQGVQILSRGARGDSGDAEGLQDQVYELLHGVTHIDLATGIHISQAWRNSATPLGRDSNDRWEATGNYYLQTARSTPNTDD